MKTLGANKLFTPIQVGSMELEHRVVMAPLTRSRSVQPGSIPGDLMLEYYSQRASEGGLIVSEGTSISIAAGGWFGAPGLYSNEQVAGWKRITDAVHGKRGHMFSQLWHTGRASHVDSTNGATPVSSSVNPEYWQDPTIKESSLVDGSSLRLTARLTSEKSQASSRTIAKRPSAQRPPVLTALSFTRVMATCPINFCRMASTSEPICMVVPSKIGPASCFKWWKRWFQCGAATVSLYASRPAELGMESRIAIRSRCLTTWQSN